MTFGGQALGQVRVSVCVELLENGCYFVATGHSSALSSVGRCTGVLTRKCTGIQASFMPFRVPFLSPA